MITGHVTFMDVIQEGGSNGHEEQHDESSGDDKDEKEEESVNQRVEVQMPKNVRRTRPAPMEILDRVTMNNTQETPRSTIKSFLNVPKQTELTFNRKNLRKVEGQLKKAFVEFYQKLRLLKSFRYMPRDFLFDFF